MNYRIITRIIGRILCVMAAFMIPALLISLFQGERGAALALLITIAASAGIGVLLALVKPTRHGFFAREGFVTVGLAWIVVSLFGALPFFISREIPNFMDALFETASGFTTTGAPARLPPSAHSPGRDRRGCRSGRGQCRWRI